MVNFVGIKPDSDYKFDKETADKMRRIILKTAKELDRPTRTNLAMELQLADEDKPHVARDRLTRLIKALSIEEEYEQIRKDAGIGQKGRKGD